MAAILRHTGSPGSGSTRNGSPGGSGSEPGSGAGPGSPQPVQVRAAAVVLQLPGDLQPPPWLLKLKRGGAGRGLWLAGFGPAGCAPPAPVDQQAVDRVGYPVEGGAHRGQPAERLELRVAGEEDFEDHAVLGVMPLVVERTVRDCRLGELVLVGVPPPARGEFVAGEDLD